MARIDVRLPDELTRQIDDVAAKLNCSRAKLVRLALQHYLDELDDLELGSERLSDPADPVLDWGVVRESLLLDTRQT